MSAAHSMACTMMGAALDEAERQNTGAELSSVLLDAYELQIRNIEKYIDKDFRWQLMLRLAEPGKTGE